MLRRVPPLPRFYSASPPKASLKLVAELRKLTEVSINKAREALIASDNDIDAALAWLRKDLVASGAKKAAKVEGRVAREGLISVSVLSPGVQARGGLGIGGVRAAMVELNCETDFVGRNELFSKLAADIAHTAAFISEPANSEDLFRACSLDLLHDAPLLSVHDSTQQSVSTVASAIRDTIAKVGEKVSLRRAVAVVHGSVQQKQPELALRLASYVHGSVNRPLQGRVGALALLALKTSRISTLMQSQSFSDDLEKLERSLARQIVGFDTQCIRSLSGEKDETALYDQPFMMLPSHLSGQTVEDALRLWMARHADEQQHDTPELEVLSFSKWSLGESIQEPSS